MAAELGARLAQAVADLNGGAAEDGCGEAAKGGWETTQELQGKLRELKEVFEKMKTDGAVDAEERAAASGLLNELHMAFGLRATFDEFNGATTFDEFESRLVREWEVTSKEQALAGANMARVVAEILPGGSPEMPLGRLEGMSGEQLQHFCKSVAAGVEMVLILQQEMLQVRRGRGDGECGAENFNAKFALGEGVELRTASYGKLEDFTTGLLAKIGLPDHRLLEA